MKHLLYLLVGAITLAVAISVIAILGFLSQLWFGNPVVLVFGLPAGGILSYVLGSIIVKGANGET